MDKYDIVYQVINTMEFFLFIHLFCQVGEGTYGQVYKAKDSTTDTLVALKKVCIYNGSFLVNNFVSFSK